MEGIFAIKKLYPFVRVVLKIDFFSCFSCARTSSVNFEWLVRKLCCWPLRSWLLSYLRFVRTRGGGDSFGRLFFLLHFGTTCSMDTRASVEMRGSRFSVVYSHHERLLGSGLEHHLGRITIRPIYLKQPIAPLEISTDY